MDIIPYPDAVGNPYRKFPVFAFLQYFIHVYSRLLLTIMPVCGIIQAQTGNNTVCMNDFDALHDLMQGQAPPHWQCGQRKASSPMFRAKSESPLQTVKPTHRKEYPMFLEERHKEILRLLEEKGSIRT